MGTDEKPVGELTPAQKARETAKRNREIRMKKAEIDAERHHQDQERVAAAMRYILDRPQDATPGLLVFAVEVLDHLDHGAGLVPYDAQKVMEVEPPDIKAFARAVQTLEVLSKRDGKESPSASD